MIRVVWILATVLAALAIALPATFRPAPRLIWNASASTPIGLYAVRAPGELHIGDLVVARPSEPLATFLAQRRYLPEGVLLLKHVYALSGQTVCRSGRAITVNGVVAGQALDRDRRGRPLPVWRGCHTVAPDEAFLMNHRPDSLDSRYFGPLPVTNIVGGAEPLWTQPGP